MITFARSSLNYIAWNLHACGVLAQGRMVYWPCSEALWCYGPGPTTLGPSSCTVNLICLYSSQQLLTSDIMSSFNLNRERKKQASVYSVREQKTRIKK